jgi:hypothetical protein
VELWGVKLAVEMGDSYIGAAHAFLAMIRTPETVTARALASLADLDALRAAVLEARNAPAGPPPDAVFLPEGQGMDGPLSEAIISALPDDATFGFNITPEGHTWVHVFALDGQLGPEVSREVLGAALAGLGRPASGD